MIMNDTCKSLVLGKFTSPIQTHLNNNNHVIVSLWSGAPLSQVQLDAMFAAHSTAAGRLNSTWPFNATTGMPNYGKVELARLIYLNFPYRYLTNEILNRVFQFSKSEYFGLGLAAGVAGSFTLCMSNSDYTNSTLAAATTGFLIEGSVGDTESSADLKLSSTSITVGKKIRLGDMKFNFNVNIGSTP